MSESKLLQQLATVFGRSGLSVGLLPPTSTVPMNRLWVELAASLDYDQLQAEVLQVPDLTAPPILQLFVLLPCTIDTTKVEDLGRYLHMVNNAIPITGFSMMESSKEIYFRLLHPFSPEQPNEELLVQTLFLIGKTIELFGPAIKRMAMGSTDFAEAIKELKELLLELDQAQQGNG